MIYRQITKIDFDFIGMRTHAFADGLHLDILGFSNMQAYLWLGVLNISFGHVWSKAKHAVLDWRIGEEVLRLRCATLYSASYYDSSIKHQIVAGTYDVTMSSILATSF